MTLPSRVQVVPRRATPRASTPSHGGAACLRRRAPDEIVSRCHDRAVVDPLEEHLVGAGRAGSCAACTRRSVAVPGCCRRAYSGTGCSLPGSVVTRAQASVSGPYAACIAPGGAGRRLRARESRSRRRGDPSRPVPMMPFDQRPESESGFSFASIEGVEDRKRLDGATRSGSPSSSRSRCSSTGRGSGPRPPRARGRSSSVRRGEAGVRVARGGAWSRSRRSSSSRRPGSARSGRGHARRCRWPRSRRGRSGSRWLRSRSGLRARVGGSVSGGAASSPIAVFEYGPRFGDGVLGAHAVGVARGGGEAGARVAGGRCVVAISVKTEQPAPWQRSIR